MASFNKSELNFNYYSSAGNFDFKEFVDFVTLFNIKSTSFTSWVRRWFKKKAEQVLQEAKGRTPVNTGQLLESWQPVKISIKNNEITAIFMNTAVNQDGIEYAGWVEYGHAKPYHAGEPPGSENWVEGRFMLTVPLQQLYNDLPQEFEAAFWEYLEKRV